MTTPRWRVCNVAGCPTQYKDTTTSGRCPDHRTEAELARGSRQTRGYDRAHEIVRAALLPAAIGTPCPLCGRTMQQDEPLDLDHTVPLAVDPTSRGDRIVHASCNRARRVQLSAE